MNLAAQKIKNIKAFIYTLCFLLVFNLFFNLNYNWYGISLIVRIYLLVFSFYFIFGFASIDIHSELPAYISKYGKKPGRLLLFLETRLFPFALIFLITIVFTLIDYIREPNWPWEPILYFLNGRYSNNIIYSLLLLITLKLKKKPSFTIPMFLGISVLYFFVDKSLYAFAETGWQVSIIKISKIIIFFMLLSYEFFFKISKSFIFSSINAAVTFCAMLAIFFSTFYCAQPASYQSNQAGLYLLRLGFNYPLKELKSIVLKTRDYELFSELMLFSETYNIKINYTDSQWQEMLFSSPVKTGEFISKVVLNKNVPFKYEDMISYAEEEALKRNNLEKAENFAALFCRFLPGHENEFIERLNSYGQNKKLTRWAILVMSKYKCDVFIPQLLDYLTDKDLDISHEAYDALKSITGLDLKVKYNKKINDPDVFIGFRQHYLQNRKGCE